MIKRAKNIPFTALLLAAFVTVALVFGAKAGFDYYKEATARKNGSLVTYTLSVEDFVYDGMREKNGQWQTTDGDPQMRFAVNGGFTGVEINADYLVYPGDIILYYTTAPGADFSRKNRVYISQDKDNSSLYTGRIPVANVADIRLDPTTVAGNMIDFGQIVINPARTLADYLAITPYHLMMWAVYSLLLGAIFRFVQEFFTKSFE